MWEEASDEVKQTYSKDYLLSWIEPEVGGWESRGDTSPVVKAAEHALTSSWPKSRYLISGSAVLLDCFAVKIPQTPQKSLSLSLSLCLSISLSLFYSL